MVKKRGIPKYINFDDKYSDDDLDMDEEDNKPKIAA